MTTLSFSDAEPLRTKADELDRVRELVGDAIVDGRLWIMLVDGDDRQTPVLMPVDDIPWHPEPGMLAGLGTILAGLADGLRTEAGPGSVLFTLERLGRRDIEPGDRIWATGLAEVCRSAGVRLRGVFASTPAGVRRVS